MELTPTPIYEIQGDGLTSTLDGQSVITSGIVTAVDSNGFYLQDAAGDGDAATSDAIFVFTGSSPAVAVGDAVMVSGTVTEFTPGGISTRNLSSTQISSPVLTVESSGNALPTAAVLGAGGLIPPTTSIEDGIGFFESLEGMLVTAKAPKSIAGTNRFGEIFTTVEGAVPNGPESANGGLVIADGDFNPERVQINIDNGILPGATAPLVDTGARLSDVTGVVGYSFGNYEILPTEAFSVTAPSTIQPEVSTIVSGDDTLTVASYNVLNLDPNDSDGDTDIANGRLSTIARQIVTNLNRPDIIGLQEIQDSSGSVNDGVTSAADTLQALIDAIVAAGGPQYAFIDNTFITDNASGGQPGANIRTAFLYNPDRVDLVAGSVQTVGGQNPGDAFFDARLPMVATFSFNGEEITLLNNHFSSKGGSAPLMGTDQPFEQLQEDPRVNGSLDERQAQSEALLAFIEQILLDPDANVLVLGDFNEFQFVSTLTKLQGMLENLALALPEGDRYSFIFQGNSQQLDHMLAGGGLLDLLTAFDIAHINADFAETDARASDHDPLLASFVFARDGVNAVPVPASLLLIALGIAALRLSHRVR